MRIRVVPVILLSIVTAVGIVVALDADFRKLDLLRLPRRAAWQLPDQVVAALGIKKGDRVVALGAGSGYFVGYESFDFLPVQNLLVFRPAG